MNTMKHQLKKEWRITTPTISRNSSMTHHHPKNKQGNIETFLSNFEPFLDTWIFEDIRKRDERQSLIGYNKKIDCTSRMEKIPENRKEAEGGRLKRSRFWWLKNK